MASETSAMYNSNANAVVDTTAAGTFIPEIWSDDVIASYKSNLQVANLVNKINHKGKKGDTIHLPAPVRGSANAIASGTTEGGSHRTVQIQANLESEVQVVIDKHYEYSRLIEDIVEVQALNSLRRFYTDDAGYALAKQMDTHLIELLETTTAGSKATTGGTAGANAWGNAVSGADGTTVFDDTSDTTADASSGELTDAAIRQAIQYLDDVDTPMSDRVLLIPPVARKTLMGLARFTEQSFVGEAGNGNTIRSGLMGDIYGVKIYVTSNMPSFQTVTATNNYRPAGLFQKEAFVLAEQIGIRSQTQYKQEYLSTLFTSDCLYGVKEIRPASGVALILPA